MANKALRDEFIATRVEWGKAVAKAYGWAFYGVDLPPELENWLKTASDAAVGEQIQRIRRETEDIRGVPWQGAPTA